MAAVRAGYSKVLNFFDDFSLSEGSSCCEKVIGTNAPSLALITREPVVVTADEHYTKTYHPAFCAASPILDENRNLLGCVDITKFFDPNISEELRKHLLNLAISLSDMIRNEVFLARLTKSSPVYHPAWGAPPRDPRDPSSGDIPDGRPRSSFARIVGSAPPLAKAMQTAKMYGRKEGNILILGETGTGKELFAQAIHDEGGRANGPFVTVNCAAIPLELAESELFGYERGAFTGARTEGHPGKFEMAHQGTIFLDEINSMPLPIQAKILRVVETKRVTRINGKRETPVDVRIIAASNRVLADEVAAGTFRKDLFYRLNVLPLRVPALREMKEDIPALLDAFFQACAEEHGVYRKRISPEGWRRPSRLRHRRSRRISGPSSGCSSSRRCAGSTETRSRPRRRSGSPGAPCTASSRNTGSPRRGLPPVDAASAAILGEQEDVPDRDPLVRPLAHVVDRERGDRRRDHRLHFHAGPVERLLRRGDPRDPGDPEHVALLHPAGPDRGDRLLLHEDRGARHRRRRND